MKVAVLGRTRMLFHAIELLEKEGHEIVLIGTCKEAPEYDIKAEDFERAARIRGIPFFNDAQINSPGIEQLLRTVYADIAISMNWLTLIGENIINCFPKGILNAHPGDLPRYRGNACPNWAMIQGEEEIGITIHYMDPNYLDAGNIVLKEYLNISEKTEIADIYDKLNEIIPHMFAKAINAIADGKSSDYVQERKGLRCYPRKPSDGRIDWNCTCRYISRIVRASGYPFGGAYTYCENEKIYIEKISYKDFPEPSLVVPGQVVQIDRENDKISIAAIDGIVTIEKGYVKSNPEQKISHIINSTRMRMGYSLEDEVYELKQNIRLLKSMYKHKM